MKLYLKVKIIFILIFYLFNLNFSTLGTGFSAFPEIADSSCILRSLNPKPVNLCSSTLSTNSFLQ